MKVRRAVFVFLIIIFGVNLFRSYLETRANLGRLNRLQDEVKELESTVESLEKEVEYKKSTAYLEREARDKLGFIKEGERVVILPEEDTLALQEGTEETPKKIDRTPNWKKWRKFLLD